MADQGNLNPISLSDFVSVPSVPTGSRFSQNISPPVNSLTSTGLSNFGDPVSIQSPETKILSTTSPAGIDTSAISNPIASTEIKAGKGVGTIKHSTISSKSPSSSYTFWTGNNWIYLVVATIVIVALIILLILLLLRKPKLKTVENVNINKECVLSWTNTEKYATVQVFYGTNSDVSPTNATEAVLLPPGTTSVTLDRLEPNTTYYVGIRYKDNKKEGPITHVRVNTGEKTTEKECPEDKEVYYETSYHDQSGSSTYDVVCDEPEVYYNHEMASPVVYGESEEYCSDVSPAECADHEKYHRNKTVYYSPVVVENECSDRYTFV